MFGFRSSKKVEVKREAKRTEDIEDTAPATQEDPTVEVEGDAEGDGLGNGEQDALQKERDEYFDLLLRKQAEFENYRKRVQREREEARIAAQAEIIGELLSVLDVCEKGLDSMKSAATAETLDCFTEGYELLLRQLRNILDRYDVREVPGVGAAFDPNVHEAVIREVGRDFEDNEIVEEYRKGYTIGDRLLRPSQVKVAVWPDE